MTHTPPPPSPTFGEMIEELMDLMAGLGAALMPALLLAVPGIILFVVLPAILLLALVAPFAAIGAVVATPYLLARRLRRRRRGRPEHVAVAAREPSLISR